MTFFWDGERLTVATGTGSKTARNLTRAGWARVARDSTEDVVIVEGPLETIPVDADDALAAAFAAGPASTSAGSPSPGSSSA